MIQVPTDPRFKNLSGQVFGRLTVVEYVGKYGRNAVSLYRCRCSCGVECNVGKDRLSSGHTQSCGCLKKDNKRGNPKHGGWNTPEWLCWSGMIRRCVDPKCQSFARYGAIGVTVCERWTGDNGFVKFLADMGKKPSRKHSIDRKNNDHGYSPENCRWATATEQAVNRHTTKLLTFNSETLPLAHWATKVGLSREIIRHRLKAGWSVKDALTKPVRRRLP